ncbi:MAG: DUF6029 family protein [Bacteroidales bacterium]|nr:DUF6029 family protein [Bacteroidales bacterium]
MVENLTIYKNKKAIIMAFLFLLAFRAAAQETVNTGQLTGNFQTDFQFYNPDSLIGAPVVPEKLLLNAFANVNYTFKNFTAGVRFESYLNALQGYDTRYNGTGIPYKYFQYNNHGLGVTVGNFYEQFGNGMIFRSYEERSLGIDNAMEGLRIKATPYKGILIKGLIGNQRNYFEKGTGIVRGIDGEFTFNDIFESLSTNKTWVSIGGSFVSRFERDKDPIYNLPENVAAAAGRLTVSRGKISLMGEYAYKFNDPSATNNFIYKPGNALYVSGTYSQKGFGVLLSAKRIDNMDFRSSRTATGNDLLINYLPALTKQHTYSFTTMYPYVTQANGEFCMQGELTFNIKKNTPLGGKYGTNFTLNFSKANAIHKAALNDSTAIGQNGTLGYSSDFLKWDGKKYFQDINITINRRLSRVLRSSITYMNYLYNIDVIEGHQGDGIMYGHVGIAEFSLKVSDDNSVKTEIQYLNTKKDDGDWAMLMLEYNIKSTWFLTVIDQYNFGNQDPDKQIHYFNLTAGYTKNANRISLTYGKQRAGVVCVGGVCRRVPASNGFAITITSSF